MAAQVVIPLSEFSRFSASMIGARAVQLGQYDSFAVPVPATIVIAQHTLAQVADEQKIFERIVKVLDTVHTRDATVRHLVKEHVSRVIKGIQLPAWFTEPLLQSYHTTFQRGFVRLLPGDIQTTLDLTLYEHIQGDANVFESLITFWADWVHHKLEEGRLQRHTLAPGSIIIQEQFQAVASGFAYSKHPISELKTQVYMAALKGCPDQELLETQADEFAVDIRTWNVVFRNVSAQTRMIQRSSDDLENVPVPYVDQLRPTLSDLQCIRLAQLVNQFKLHTLGHHKLLWELTNKGFFFTGFLPYSSPDGLAHARPANQARVLTKLYISAGNPHRAQALAASNHDGVGILRSEYTYAQFGLHPGHVLHSRQREVLERQLEETIESYRSAVSYQRVIFRSQNFTSQELRQLEYGNAHEQQEPNPFLGYRGGLKLCTQPELMKLELTALRRALEHHGGAIGYMLPFVRSPQELSVLVHHIESAGLLKHPQFEIWWQLNTPENILNFKAYPTHYLAGVSLNTTTIQALLNGLDPDNPDVFERYQLSTEALEHLMEHLAKNTKELLAVRPTDKPLLLNLHLENFSRELVATAVKLRYHGIVVKPRALEIARVCVQEQEETQLLSVRA